MSSKFLTEVYTNRRALIQFMYEPEMLSTFKAYLYRKLLAAGATKSTHAVEKNRGLGIFFFKQFLDIHYNTLTVTYAHAHVNLTQVMHTLRSGTSVVTYNTHGLYMIFYNLFLFFFYAGSCEAKFATLTQDQLAREGVALNYFTYHRFTQGTFYQRQLESHHSVDRALTYQFRYWFNTYSGIDFLFFLDAALSDHIISILTQLPTHIIGITTDIRCIFYFDTVLPFEAISLEIQYFFVECALFAFLSGRRAGVRDRLITGLYI